jgi:hypothetical protein
MKGGNKMNKKITAALVCMVAILSVLLTPIALASAPAIKCDWEITFDPVQWAWLGTITFPDESSYSTIVYADTEPRFVGHPTEEGSLFPRHLEQFYETFEIKDGDTVLATGYDEGIFSSDTWKFVMKGKVETAYDELSYLEGANMHIRGVAWIVEGVFFGEATVTFTGYRGN